MTLQDGLCSGLFDRLAERHRVIAFDRPGFGYSERPRDRLWTSLAQARLFHQAFNALNLQSPVVLGHSWGTLVALDLAVEFPANVRGLMLVSGYYYPSARLDAAISAPAAIPLLGDAMRYTVSPVSARLLLKRTAEAMCKRRGTAVLIRAIRDAKVVPTTSSLVFTHIFGGLTCKLRRV
ncbi:alpha/beta fold hydrolase, partial [Caballeronia sp. EK]|uniref:alpha/beta fold hydrolase n=1 Tax=Caballeronia sp. EK TaxID=2767469 RepID=UPI002814ACDC